MNKSLFIVTGLLSIGLVTKGKVLATEDGQQKPGLVVSTEGKGIQQKKKTVIDGFLYHYEGEVNENGKPDGYGIFINDDRRYEGQFKNGRRDGKGVMIFPPATPPTHCMDEIGCWKKYDGDWINGKMHGQGVLEYDDGVIYEGSFKDDKLQGEGKLRNNYGEGPILRKGQFLYEGPLLNGEEHGYGKMKFLIHNIYARYYNFKDKFGEKDTYEGDFVKGKISGKGIITYTNGAVYEGEFVVTEKERYGTGNRHGKGKMTFPKSDTSCFKDKFGVWDTYEGNWVNGVMEGHGILKYTDGTTYEGSFIPTYDNDSETGNKGKVTSPNGDVYNGELDKGNKEGFGKMVSATGEVYIGRWHANNKHGRGILVLPTSKEYQERQKIAGKFLNGELREGTGRNLSSEEAKAVDGLLKSSEVIEPGQISDVLDMIFKSSPVDEILTNVEEMSWNNGVYKGSVNERGEPHGEGEVKYDGSRYTEESAAEKDLYNWLSKEHPDKEYEYKGQFKNGKRDGKGVMTWPGRAPKDDWGCFQMYDGDWKNDLVEGHGKILYTNGHVYEGLFKNGEKLSKRKVAGIDGYFGPATYYSGEVNEKGKPDGYGNITSGHYRESYIGEFKDGARHGKGTMIFRREKRYSDEIGQWKKYEGDWSYGEMDGQGTLKYNDGIIYEGSFEDGEKSGPCKITFSKDFSSGVKSLGFFNNCYPVRFGGPGKGDYPQISTLSINCPSEVLSIDLPIKEIERGTITYADGTVYEGQIKKNEITNMWTVAGSGKAVWSDGSVYEGEWQDNFQRGKGVMRSTSEGGIDVYDGEWRRGSCMEGLGRSVKADGTEYIGEWWGNDMRGRGILICPPSEEYPNGRQVVGEFNYRNHEKDTFRDLNPEEIEMVNKLRSSPQIISPDQIRSVLDTLLPMPSTEVKATEEVKISDSGTL
jgi:hypothetical protein